MKQQLPADALTYVKRKVKTMQEERRTRWPIMREVARTFLPYTLPNLLDKQKNETIGLNPHYISSVGLKALRTQTAGLMNGVTSPTRPWFKFGIGANEKLLSWASRKWLSDVTDITYTLLKRSNYYQAAAERFFDLGLFNVSGTQIYDDRDSVFRVHRFPTGQFYVIYDMFGRVRAYARIFKLPLAEMIDQWGLEALSAELQNKAKNPVSLDTEHEIVHFVESTPSSPMFNHPADKRPWREVYYLAASANPDCVLAIAGYREQPATFPRWSADLTYGDCPATDALADMRELTQILIKKGVALEKLVDPPMVFDESLRTQQHSTMPGGVSYIRNLNEAVGGRPLYQTNIPFQELRADINEIRMSIQETFHNDLFRMISQLDTVRSATEIDARREEKLVLLAHFLERHENESLTVELDRIFNICLRAGLYPDPPQELQGAEIDIKYVSMLSTAQRAINTVPTERLLGLIGNIASVNPAVLDTVNFDELVYSYSIDIGAHPTILRDQNELRAQRAAREEQAQKLEATATAQTAIAGAQALSQTDVGGGANALQRILS